MQVELTARDLRRRLSCCTDVPLSFGASLKLAAPMVVKPSPDTLMHVAVRSIERLPTCGTGVWRHALYQTRDIIE